MKRHEELCYRNPKNKRLCFSCIHLEKKKTTVATDYYGQEKLREVDIFHCIKRNHFLYTPQNEIKKNVYELDEENRPMATICSDFKKQDADYFFSQLPDDKINETPNQSIINQLSYDTPF